MTQSDKMSKIHSEAMEQFNRVQTACRDERMQCLQDRRFYSISGAQWEGPLSIQFENKPRIEVNKVHLAVIRIINEYRNNRITVDFVAKDGSDKQDLPDMCASLYRATEQDSSAEEAYDNAFEEAVGGGFGAWRLRNEYEDDSDPDDDKQRICIEPIYDADSCVYFDLDAKRQDKADANHCFVLVSMTHSAYEAEYGESPVSMGKIVHQRLFDWCTPDVVYVAEYYRVVHESDVVHIYEGIGGEERRVSESELSEDEGLAEELRATGFREIRQKKIKRKRVRKYIIDGNKVLEDCGYIAGENIPIIPVYGKRWFVDNVERCMGHVRLAKDAQRLKNMQLSKLAEISALSSVEKPIFTPEQVAGHQVMWSEDNLKNYPYLLINQLTDGAGNPALIGPSSYVKSPEIPPAMAALLQLTDGDMKELLGNQEAGEQLNPNLSGKAIELVQNRLDMQAYIYMSNMAKAVKRSGEVWLSMAKEVYVEPKRMVRGVDNQGKSSQIELLRPVLDKKGKVVFDNDLSEAKFDVAVDVGPTSNSKREATVRSLLNLLQITADPQTQQVLTSMIIMNMQGEGMTDVREYFRSQMVKAGVVKPTEEEAAVLAQQQQQPDPQAQYLQAAAEQQVAAAEKAKADTVLAVAKAEETRAKTAATMSKMDVEHGEAVIRAVQTLGDKVSPSSATL